MQKLKSTTLRNLNRTFVFQKALAKFSKKFGHLRATEADILYAFFLNNGKHGYVSVSQVGKTLATCKKCQNYSHLYKVCEKLFHNGYLLPCIECKIKKYRLSIPGLNLLTHLEVMARAERWDR